MPAEWLSGHIAPKGLKGTRVAGTQHRFDIHLRGGDDAREMYSYSLEGQNELLQFLKACSALCAESDCVLKILVSDALQVNDALLHAGKSRGYSP